MEKLKINKEIQINTAIQKVFDFLTDPAKIPLVMPGLVENTNIPELPLKVGSSFKFKYEMMSIVEEGTWTVTEINSPNSYQAKTTGRLPSNFKYTLAEKDGGTFLQVEIEYQAPESVIAKVETSVVKSLNEKETDKFLENIKTALEL